MKDDEHTGTSGKSSPIYKLVSKGDHAVLQSSISEFPLGLTVELIDDKGQVYSSNLSVKISDGGFKLSGGYFKKEKKSEKPQPLQAKSEEERLETRRSDLETAAETFTDEQLQPYFNSHNAAPYARRIETLMRKDGIIPSSAINELPTTDKIRFRLTLSSLTKKESRPVEKVGDDYKVIDRDVFKKIEAAARNLKKK